MLSKRAKTILQWGLVIVIMAVLVHVGDVSDLVRMPALHLPSLLWVFLSMVIFTLVHNLRWTAIIKAISSSPQDKKCEFFQCYQWLMNSYVLGTVIPSDISLAGVRTFYINRSQILPLPVALFSVLVDRFFDFVVFLLLAIPAALLITGAVVETDALFLAGIICMGFFLFASQKKQGGRRIMGIYRFGMDRVLRLPVLGKRVRERWGDAISRTSFDERSLSRMIGWSLLKYLFMAIRFYFTGQSLGVDFSLLQSIFFIPFIQVFAMLNITPGGLGVVEASSYGALKLMGVTEPRIMVFVVGQRILTYGITIAIALISYLLLTFRSKTGKVEVRQEP
jgi:uncharacterized protein (TIRG00374 family)